MPFIQITTCEQCGKEMSLPDDGSRDHVVEYHLFRSVSQRPGSLVHLKFNTPASTYFCSKKCLQLWLDDNE